MKILLLASVFPPKIIGGAELSAHALAKWLAGRGHEVGVLTVAQRVEDEVRGQLIDGLRVWRIKFPRLHTQHEHRAKAMPSKLLWHLQDHFDPRNGRILESVVRDFEPDVVNVHVMQGLGHNALTVFAKRNIPVFYFVHDLTLACFRTSMYKADRNCSGQCFPCRVSTSLKLRAIRNISSFQLISPSRSNLVTLDQVLNARGIAGSVLPNLDPAPSGFRKPRGENEAPRLIYVGRLDSTKGIDWILPVLEEIVAKGNQFHLTVVGGGPIERQLRSEYEGRAWIRFTGQIPPAEVASHISRSDLLLLPSLWRENHPGVVRQALRSGVPAMVSDIGGSKEMVSDGESGIVLPVGNAIAWSRAIIELLQHPDQLEPLQQGAVRAGRAYSSDNLGIKFEEMLLKALQEEAVQAGPALHADVSLSTR
jgi:glycosyltransferase involved in cell wall biosynthesis